MTHLYIYAYAVHMYTCKIRQCDIVAAVAVIRAVDARLTSDIFTDHFSGPGRLLRTVCVCPTTTFERNNL